MEDIDEIQRALARQDHYEQVLRASPDGPEFELFVLTPPGAGKDALRQSLMASSEDFRWWWSIGEAVWEMCLAG